MKSSSEFCCLAKCTASKLLFFSWSAETSALHDSYSLLKAHHESCKKNHDFAACIAYEGMRMLTWAPLLMKNARWFKSIVCWKCSSILVPSCLSASAISVIVAHSVAFMKSFLMERAFL